MRNRARRHLAPRSSMIRALMSPSLLNTALPLTQPPPGVFYRSLAGGRATLNGQADVGGRTSIRLCSRESSAAAGTGAGSRGLLMYVAAPNLLSRRASDRMPADVGQAPAAPSRGALCRLGGLRNSAKSSPPPCTYRRESLAIADSRREK